jgi:hypothetical protein
MRRRWTTAVDTVQLRAVRIRQRFEQNRIDGAKHGGVGADAEPERDDGEEGEPGAARERATGEVEAG